MKIREIQKICAPNSDYERNEELCRQLSRIDERLIYHVDRNIINLDRGQNPIQNLDDLLDGVTNTSAENVSKCEPWYNTWPFGVPTDKIFPRFIAICRDNKRLDTTFKKMLEQSEKIARAYRNVDCEKTVILLTDKWNLKTFKKYEKDFLNYALRYGIWYVFLLVTEYGYNEIPFLPHDRRALKKYEYENIEHNPSVEEMLNFLQDLPIEYCFYGGTWGRHKFTEYIFYTDKLIWLKKSSEGQCEGKIPQRALFKFLENISWIFDYNEKEITPNIRILDASISSLYIFGRTFKWYNVSDPKDKRIAAMKIAVRKFIEECEKRTDK